MKKEKQIKQDFKENELPSNRVQVFFDCIKLRYSLIFKLGLMLVLFSLPLLAASVLKDSFLYSIQMSLAKGAISEADYTETYKMILRISYLVYIPCFAVLSLGIAGSLRVIRQLVWGEGVFFRQDFFYGVKKNAGHYVFYSLLIGVLHYLSRMAFYLEMDGWLAILKYLPSAIAMIVFIPAIIFCIVQSQLYSLNLGLEMKNGFLLYIRTFFKSLLALIVVLLPVGFIFIEIVVIKAISELIYILFLLPFVLMGVFLFINSVLDKYINKEHYPEIYDLGIYRKK